MGEKYTKWLQNTTNGHKLYQNLQLQDPPSSIARPSKIYPNWNFGFENISSGNPGPTPFFAFCIFSRGYILGKCRVRIQKPVVTYDIVGKLAVRINIKFYRFYLTLLMPFLN
jgi:hypothetical protein